MWRTLSGRIYPEWARIGGGAAAEAGLRKRAATPMHAIEDYMNCGRPGDNLIHPLFADALMVGARVTGNGIEVNLVGDPETWPAKHVIHTPWGHLELSVEVGDGRATFHAKAPREFPVTVKAAGGSAKGTSTGSVELPLREPAAARVG
jgi:hypothetical protein